MGTSLTTTERINSTVNVCPQILQGILERPVSVYATSMDLSAMGNYDTEDRHGIIIDQDLISMSTYP